MGDGQTYQMLSPWSPLLTQVKACPCGPPYDFAVEKIGRRFAFAMSLKSKCCKKYKRKAKACSGCPIFALMSSKRRKKELRKARRKLQKAA